MDKKDITDKLDAAGIEYDKRLGAEKLAELLPSDAKDDQSKKGDTVTCTILRDYWDDEGTRHRKGRVVEVPAMAALEGVENGLLKRVR